MSGGDTCIITSDNIEITQIVIWHEIKTFKIMIHHRMQQYFSCPIIKRFISNILSSPNKDTFGGNAFKQNL